MEKILLVDLDNTLLDFDKTENEALSKVLLHFNIEDNIENRNKYYDINVAYWKKYELHQIEREKLLGLRFVDFFSLFDLKVDGFLVNEMYFSFLSQNAYKIKNCEEFCKKCHELDYRIIIASNGVGSVQKPRLEKSGLLRYFDRVYLSEEIGFNKPDVEFFETILKDYPFKDKMVMIGDSLSSDIQGGKNFNVPTIWYNPKGNISNLPDYQVKDLLEIFKVLEEI